MREGIAIGEARSKARNIENSLVIAQRMIAAGYDRETIKEITQLTDSELAELQ